MPVSVVIPSLNSPMIDRTIASLIGQNAFDQVVEVLIVGCDEPGLIPQAPRVRFINTGRAVTAPIARNIGIRAAQAEVLAFVDADCVAEREWLAHLLAAVAAGSQVVSGAIAFDDDNYWATAYNLSMFHEFLPSAPAGPRGHLPSMNLLVCRPAIEAVGLFNETLARGQDTEWTVRMREHGYRLDFAPAARVRHQHARRSARTIWDQWVKAGAYSVEIRLRHAGSLAAPRLLRSPAAISLLAPLIAFGAATRIYLKDPATLRYLRVWPAVYLTKLAWCVGAARASRAGAERQAS